MYHIAGRGWVVCCVSKTPKCRASFVGKTILLEGVEFEVRAVEFWARINQTIRPGEPFGLILAWPHKPPQGKPRGISCCDAQLLRIKKKLDEQAKQKYA